MSTTATLTATRRAEHRAMVRRITAAWSSASAADLAAGLEWYDTARAACDALAAGTSGRVTTEQAAGVVAALSPRMPWARNLTVAAAVIDAHVDGRPAPAMALRRNLDVACAILDGRQSGPTGRKVSAFARAILGDTAAVVVDVWAARAAGHPMPDGKGLTPRQYDAIAAAYTDAAERLGVAPRDLQAAVWVVVRGSAS